jgi:protein YibB
MTHEVSIVTAFFDIGRGNWRGFVRSNEQYLEWFKNLARLKNEMVIFTEQKFVNAILDIRTKNGLGSITTVISCDHLFGPNGQLVETNRLLGRAMRPELHAFVRDPGCPEYWNADYVLLNLLKTVFVSIATKLGLNANQQIAWIDFGYCRDAQRFDPNIPWQFDCGGRMNIFHIREPDDRPIFDIVRTGDVYFQGCHIVGPAECWHHLSRLVDDAMASLLACGLVDDDQTVLLMAYRRAPDLFKIHAVDPSDWFVLFRNFKHTDVTPDTPTSCAAVSGRPDARVAPRSPATDSVFVGGRTFRTDSLIENIRRDCKVFRA